MLLADLMERSDDGPLEEGPSAFDAIRVDIAPNPFIGTVCNPFVTSPVKSGDM